MLFWNPLRKENPSCIDLMVDGVEVIIGVMEVVAEAVGGREIGDMSFIGYRF